MNKKNKFIYSKLILVLCIAVLMSACVNDDKSDSSSSGSENGFDEVSMMLNVTDNVILNGYDTFKALAETLNDQTVTYCAAIGTSGEAQARVAVQHAWQTAMRQWQQAELWILGPVAENSASLRNRIYAFSDTARLSTCGADQAVVLAQQPSFDINSRANNHRGLLVMEYLLFNDDLTHTCPSQVVQTQDWNARGDVQRKQWRCEYARQSADDTVQSIDAIIEAWRPANGNYRATFLDPRNYETSLNALSDALFYLDKEIKDLKLGIPLSIHADCPQINCADELESVYSRTSLENILNNLIGFRSIYTGGSGLGFDDLITDNGYSEVSNDLLDDINAAITAVEQLIVDAGNGGLYDLVASINSAQDEAICANAVANPDQATTFSACQTYGLIKRVSDHLKTDFVTIVNLDLPDRAQSDND